MELSIFLASMMGPLFILVACGILLNRKTYNKLVDEFLESYMFIYFSGVIAFVAGFSIVYFHNIWVWDWRVIITLLGWASVLKGSVRIIYPDFVKNYGKVFRQTEILATASIALLILGGILSAVSLLNS